MAIEQINVGSAPNDGTGDTLRNGATKINNNNLEFIQQIDLNDTKITTLANSKIDSVLGSAVDKTVPLNPIINLPKYVNSKAGITRPSQTTVGLINQQGNIYEEYLSLTYAPTITDNYRLSLSFSWSANNNQFNALFRISITDGTTTEFFILRTEPKDVAGTGIVLDVLQGGAIVGQADTGTDVRLFESSFSDYTLDVGKTYTVTLEWANEDANSETAIFGGFLSLEQKTINP